MVSMATSLDGLGALLGRLLPAFHAVGAPAADTADQIVGRAPVLQRLVGLGAVVFQRGTVILRRHGGVGVQRVRLGLSLIHI